MNRIRSLPGVLAGTSLFLIPVAAHGQDAYPVKPVRIVIGFAAGGGTDVVLRLIAARLNDLLGVNVVVDNKPGANGNIAGEIVARSPADGYTLLYNTSSIILSPALYSKLGYDLAKDLAPVSVTANMPLVLGTYPGVSAATVQDFVGYLKASPGRVPYGTAGNGNITHLSTLLFEQATGTLGVHVPYKSEAPAIADLIGGQVQYAFGTAVAMIPLVREKRVKGLAVTSLRRIDAIGDVPTLHETVAKGMDLGAWSGIMAPAGTPGGNIAKLNAALARATQDPELRAKLNAQSVEARYSSPEQYGAFLRSELERWGGIIRKANIRLD